LAGFLRSFFERGLAEFEKFEKEGGEKQTRAAVLTGPELKTDRFAQPKKPFDRPTKETREIVLLAQSSPISPLHFQDVSKKKGLPCLDQTQNLIPETEHVNCH